MYTIALEVLAILVTRKLKINRIDVLQGKELKPIIKPTKYFWKALSVLLDKLIKELIIE